MLRTHTCGELRIEHLEKNVSLCGWIQTIRDKGGIVWIDLRDRYGVTQLVLEEGVTPADVISKAKHLGREYVLNVCGTVIERRAKNPNIATGEIEVRLDSLEVLNSSKTPPFTIENDTDGGTELRMKYRYLDLRRTPLQKNIMLRHNVMQHTRTYLNENSFLEIETPALIKSTPEGARDFVVPSRMQQGQFYALPQSPQMLKQLLMVAGFDRYYQIVKCFRDEDLRADRQPEFTQIDCELSFINQEDIITIFERFIKFVFEKEKGIKLSTFQRMSYAEAMKLYGSDKPDLRFGMPFVELTHLAKESGFKDFDEADLIVGICAQNCINYTRKQIDSLVDFLRQPQIGAKGLVYVKCELDGSFKSSVDKFFESKQLAAWADAMGAKPGDLLMILAGKTDATRSALSELRLKVGSDLGLRDGNIFAPLWVVDFPLLEWDEASQRYYAKHHPFTSPKEEDIPLLKTSPEAVRANAYDLVINGLEIGGGSLRIYKKELQDEMFHALGLNAQEIVEQFGFFLEALNYGTPPHGGIALGLDRLCAVLSGEDSIRSFIAFPKNNQGRDVMLEAPSTLSEEQLKELGIKV